MRLISAPGLGLAPLLGRLNFPGHSLTLIAKATVALVPGGMARLLTDRPALPTGDAPYAEDELGLGTPRYPSDFAFQKPRGEVTVVGHFYAPGRKPVRASEVAFGIDGKTTRLSVIGRRQYHGKGRLPSANEAEPFNRLALRWEHAYGGPGHSVNPVGMGYVAPQSLRPNDHGPARDFARQPLALPRIERSDLLLTELDQALEPVCFAPRAATWPVRRDLFGTCDERWLKTRWPWFPEDFDARYFLSALPALQQKEYLRGDECLQFKNMHASLSSYQTRLPGMAAIAVVQRRDADGSGSLSTQAISLNLDTLWVDMDAELAQLVWRGSIPCQDADATDIAYAWVGLESRTRELSPADVRARGMQAITEDEAQWQIVAERAPEPPTESEPLLEPEPEPEQAENAEIAALLAALPVVPVEPSPSLSAAQRAQIDAQAAKLEAELEAQEQAEQEMHAKNRPPPWTRERVRAEPAALAGADLSGLDLSGEDLSGVDLSAALLSDACLDRARLVGANLSGATLTGASLNESDLSGAQLQDANLSRCRGKRVKLARAVLTRANLAESVLTELGLDDADLSLLLAAAASMPNARFNGCKLDDANLEGAQLEGATFDHCSLNAVRFVDAQLSGSAFHACQLKEADFERCQLARATIHKSCLDDALLDSAQGQGLKLEASSVVRLRAADADLSASRWLDLTGEDLICEGANLAGAQLERCHLKGADFSGVNLARARISGCALVGAKFGKADLSEAQLLGSDCFESSFEGARLLHCDASGSSFFRAEFLDAQIAGFYGQKRDLTGTKLEPAGD